MAFVYNSLTHPTQNGRSAQVPYAPFHGTNGVHHDLGLSIPGIGGGFGSVYDRGTNYNNGVNSTNQPITKQFAQRTDTIFGSDECALEQPVFTSGYSSNLSYEASNYIVSLYALNDYLRSPAGRPFSSSNPI